jgi:hypothetical protein
MQEDGEETKWFPKRAICRELACHTEEGECHVYAGRGRSGYAGAAAEEMA